MGDLAVTTRIQLRGVYDLSVIHRAPLSLEDPEDRYLVFAYAMGLKA